MTIGNLSGNPKNTNYAKNLKHSPFEFLFVMIRLSL